MGRGDAGYLMAERLLEYGATPGVAIGDAHSVGAPLHDAARRGNAALTALLIAHGADVSSSTGELGQAPLHAAAQHASAFLRCDSGHADVVQLLLQHGASPLQLDDAGQKPLIYAFDASLRVVLMLAEKQWVKRALALALKTHSPGPSVVCMRMPEIFEAVGDWF